MELAGNRILLILAGGIAAYKSLDLIRRLRDRGATVRCVLTPGGARFVTPLAVAALSEQPVFQDLFSLTDDYGMSHIQLSREADLVVVAPATADLLAKMAAGLADDLASTVLLASDKPVMVAPAMNQAMWHHPATQANLATLEARGVLRVGPAAGDLACGEVGEGRMAEVPDIVAAIIRQFGGAGPLAGRHALVTSGPTHEAIDPVRYIANRSSGKQGHAIAAALRRLGARVTLVSGPVSLNDPAGVTVERVETAEEMLRACLAALPADMAVCAAAVADWRVQAPSHGKVKKVEGAAPPVLTLTPNPDILATLAGSGTRRPRLVVGFAAETAADQDQLIALGRAKLARKGCDLILANDVSAGSGVFGGDDNRVVAIDARAADGWAAASKAAVAERLALWLADHLGEGEGDR